MRENWYGTMTEKVKIWESFEILGEIKNMRIQFQLSYNDVS